MNYDDLVRKLEELYVRDGTNYVQWAAKAIRELQRDAGRYRWLKANHLQTGADSWIRTGDDLEEAIDKTMEQSHE